VAKRTRSKAILRPSDGPRIACINKAKVSLGVDFDKLIPALQTFLDDCFVPGWGTPARLVKANKEIHGAWTMVFLDNADVKDAEGYHDIKKNGLPLSKVFVVPTVEQGDKVSVTACHELAEMLVDPAANLWSDGPRGTIWAYEVCDPVEDDVFPVDGIPMSDFVYPSYFELFRLKQRKTAPYDYLDKLKKPFSLRPGGYVDVRQGRRVKERFGSAAKARRFAKEDRRFHRSEFRKGIAARRGAMYQAAQGTHVSDRTFQRML
jgi:hypothetical protein